MAQIVHSDLEPGTSVRGQIFADKKFFVLQRVPSRTHFVKLIEANGGLFVLREDQADYVIADHARRDAPVGSVSYTFIEAAHKNGELPETVAHMAGAKDTTVRQVGSTMISGKSTRTAFTAEDDRMLYRWVKDYEAAGGRVKGMEIYKQLQAKVGCTLRWP